MRKVENPVFFGYSFIYPIHYDCFPHHLTPISHYRLHPGPLHNSTLRCRVASLGNPAYDPSLNHSFRLDSFMGYACEAHGLLGPTLAPHSLSGSPISFPTLYYYYHYYHYYCYYYCYCYCYCHYYHYHYQLLLPLRCTNPSTPWTITATLCRPIGRFLFPQLLPPPTARSAPYTFL